MTIALQKVRMEKSGKMKNVLIVDDENSFLLSLLQGLDAYAADFNTLTAANGKAAIDVLSATRISLVVTDLKMPEMDGFGLLAYMSKMHPDIPVIVMSAYCTPEIKIRLNSPGLYDPENRSIYEFVEHILQNCTRFRRYIKGITFLLLQLAEMEKKTCTSG
jgi:DNA-binding NtrC family response regulator